MVETKLVDRDKDLPPDEERCQATTQSGERCKKAKVEGSDYCHIHQKDSSQLQKKFDKEKKEQFIRVIEEGYANTLTAAAGIVGVSRSTPANHVDPESKLYDPEFAERYHQAKNAKLAQYEKELQRSALGEYNDGKPYWPALKFALENMSNGEWKSSKNQEINVSQSQSQEQKSDSVDYDKAKDQLKDFINDAINEESA